MNIAGWYFSDGQPQTNNHTWYFLATTTPTTIVQPGQIIVVSKGPDASNFQFSLGASDTIILNNGQGFEVERYSWTNLPSAGRCPDGTGAFRAMTPTKGLPNACSSDGGTD